MAKIICPNKQYNGISASVSFTNGIGQTDNPKLIKWFKKHGYTVEGEKQGNSGEGGGIETMTVKELKAYSDEKGIDLTEAKNKAEIVALIMKAESDESEDDPDDEDESDDTDTDDEGGNDDEDSGEGEENE